MPAPALPPRVLVISPDQWPRALLRATLRERGYDAIGTRSVAGALRLPSHLPGRGPVDVIIVDQEAVLEAEREAEREAGAAPPATLFARYPSAATMLLARASVQPPGAPRPWTRVLRRPFSVEDIATAVEALRPLPPEGRRPLD